MEFHSFISLVYVEIYYIFNFLYNDINIIFCTHIIYNYFLSYAETDLIVIQFKRRVYIDIFRVETFNQLDNQSFIDPIGLISGFDT